MYGSDWTAGETPSTMMHVWLPSSATYSSLRMTAKYQSGASLFNTWPGIWLYHNTLYLRGPGRKRHRFPHGPDACGGQPEPLVDPGPLGDARRRLAVLRHPRICHRVDTGALPRQTIPNSLPPPVSRCDTSCRIGTRLSCRPIAISAGGRPNLYRRFPLHQEYARRWPHRARADIAELGRSSLHWTTYKEDGESKGTFEHAAPPPRRTVARRYGHCIFLGSRTSGSWSAMRV